MQIGQERWRRVQEISREREECIEESDENLGENSKKINTLEKYLRKN